MKDGTQQRNFLIFASAVLLGVILRCIYLQQYSSSPLFLYPCGPDVEEYAARAREIVGGIFLWRKLDIHAPLYPYLLAFLQWLFSFDNPLIRAAHLLIGLLVIVPLCGAAWLAEGRRFTPAVAGTALIWAAYPPLIFYQGEYISETLVVLLLCSSIFCLYEGDGLAEPLAKGLGFLAAGGLLAGLAVTAHPLSAFFVVLETGFLCVKAVGRKGNAKKMISPAVFLIGASIPVLAVISYNSLVLSAGLRIQDNAGFNFYLGNSSIADGTCKLRPGPEWSKVHMDAEKAAKELGISKEAYFFRESFKFIASQPLGWLLLLGKKAAYAWNWRELTAGADSPMLRYHTPLQKYGAWASAVLMILGLAYIFSVKGSLQFKNRHFLLLLISFCLGQILFVTSGRYRLPMLPAVIFFAASMAVEHTRSFLQDKSWNRLALSCGVPLLAACIIVFIPAPSGRTKEDGEAMSILGEAYLKAGNLDEAEKCISSAFKLSEPWSRNYNLMGMICERKGLDEKALAMYAMSGIGTADGAVTAVTNTASFLSRTGRAFFAEANFKRAFELGQPDSNLLYNYGLFLQSQGRLQEATEQYSKCLEMDPVHRLALNNLGTIEMARGSCDAARKHFAIAFRLDPGNLGLAVNLAAAESASGDPRNALKRLSKVLRKRPGFRPALELRRQIEADFRN